MIDKRIRRTFTLQIDHSDCGVACLLSVIKFYGGDNQFHTLRRLSNTQRNGTTLSGLYRAAQKVGFNATGVRADLKSLTDQKKPSILHVLKNGNLEHYIVFYGSSKEINKNKQYLVGDPAIGLTTITELELNQIWINKVALVLDVNDNFNSSADILKRKRLLLVELIKPDFNMLLSVVFLGLIISALGLSTALFSQKLIDNILPMKHMRQLEIGLLLLFIILIAKSTLTFLRQNLLVNQSRHFNERITVDFLSKLIDMPKSFFDEHKIGDMTSRLNDISVIQKNIAYVIGTTVNDSLIVIMAIAFICSFSYLLGIVSIAALLAICFMSYKYIRPVTITHRELMVAHAHNESSYIDSFRAIGTIKGNNYESVFFNLNKQLFSLFQFKFLQLGKISNRYSFSLELSGVLLTGLFFLLASMMVINHAITLGQMVSVLTMLQILLPSITRLSQVNFSVQEAKVAIDRMFDFTELSIEERAGSKKIHAFSDQLELRNVGFSYGGKKKIFGGLNLKILKGQYVAIIGETGGGKSTLFQLLQKFYPIDNGEILIDNINIDDFESKNLRKLISSVPQDIDIFNASLLWNISLSDDIEENEKVLDMCGKYGFHQYFDKLPQGYYSTVGEGGLNLSGGQKQLVGLARCVCKDSDLIFLDEITAAMDSNTEEFVINLLDKLRELKTIIFITHKYQTIKSADNIIVIGQGGVEDMGSHDQLIQRDNLYSKYYRSFFDIKLV